MRENNFAAVYPYDGTFLSVDLLLKAMFLRMLDVKLLEENKGKLGIAGERSHGGAVFLNRQRYIKAGLDNENFNVWGPRDLTPKTPE